MIQHILVAVYRQMGIECELITMPSVHRPLSVYTTDAAFSVEYRDVGYNLYIRQVGLK